MAGLAAAKDLRAAGLNVVVLEGRNRLGGRTFTAQTKAGPIDAGAAWIHGIQGNPMSELVKSLSLKVYATEGSQTQLDAATGEELSDAQDSRSSDLWDTFESYMDDNADPQQSVQDLLTKFYASNDAKDLKITSDDKVLLDFNIHSNLEMEFAGSAADLDAARYDEDSELPGDDQYFELGYVSIVNALADGTNVMLNQTVTSISQSDTGVVVSTDKQLRCEGKFALVTVPLGVLKKNVISFTPPLPADKQAAITGQGMGLLNKVVLVFDKVFWSDSDWIERVGATPKGIWAEFFSVASASDKPVLIAFLAADHAWQVDNDAQLTDEAVVDQVMKVLASLYNNVPTKPVDYLVTHWGRDPFSYGSYSFVSKTAPLDVYKALSSSAGRVAFAGEACNSSFPGTVHGAYGSGRYQADLLIKAAKSSTGGLGGAGNNGTAQSSGRQAHKIAPWHVVLPAAILLLLQQAVYGMAST